MAKIKSFMLAADVLDRLDNLVVTEQVPDALRQKLVAPVRLLHAINQAYFQFVRIAAPEALQHLISVVDPTPDPAVPEAESLRVYLWPDTANQDRADGGLINVVLSGIERPLSEAISLPSLRMQAGSVYYGAQHRVFSYDMAAKRLYCPGQVDLEARIVGKPTKLTTIKNESGTGIVGELEVEDIYAETISLLALQELGKGSQNPSNLGVIAQAAPVTVSATEAAALNNQTAGNG